jgi:hypothetical protein
MWHELPRQVARAGIGDGDDETTHLSGDILVENDAVERCCDPLTWANVNHRSVNQCSRQSFSTFMCNSGLPYRMLLSNMDKRRTPAVGPYHSALSRSLRLTHFRKRDPGKCVITRQHATFFDTFGFIVFRGLLSRNEMARIDDEFERAMLATRHERGLDNQKRLSRLFMDQDTPFMASLALDSRFGEAAQLLLQRPVLCIHVAGARYSGDTRWHSDNFELAYSGIKFVVYLERLNARNGALRLIPGSHKNPMWQMSKLTDETDAVFGVQPVEIPSYVFESEPGDVLAFCHALWHASFNGGPCRRMLEINYYSDPKTNGEKKAFLTQMRWNHQPSAELGVQMYPRYWRSLEGNRPWIRRLRALRTLETPQIRPGSRLP